MTAPDARSGYTEVDRQPDNDMVLAAMDATAAWPAVRQLRAWERDRLEVGAGSHILDVGCGLADVAISLAPDAMPGGRVVALDASTAMLEVARQRADAAGVEVEFRTADAERLDQADSSFDVVRSERVLQWLTDPARAVGEMVRVLRPGGRLSITDTDWQTLTIDLPDHDAAFAFKQAVWAFRGAPASVGSQLLNLCRDAGLGQVEVTSAVHTWTHWNPDTEAAPVGIWPLEPVVKQMIDADLLDATTGERFVNQLLDAARCDRFFMSLGMYAVTGII